MDKKAIMNANDNITDFANEKCWQTGIYNTECDCGLCDHSYECSGSSVDDDE